MIVPAKPDNERERLAALERYAILDTDPEAEFDAVTQLIARICEVPIALVSLIDSDRQWFKSRCGLSAAETSRDISFCGHAILEPERVLIVADALADERFADNPLVTGPPHIRFYAGAPLVAAGGAVIGTLCVIDTIARDLSAHQLETLKLGVSALGTLFEQRLTIRELRGSVAAQQRVEAQLRSEISQRHRVERQLSFSSSHDNLTQLPNRAKFLDRLAEALARLRQDEHERFAMCFLDLDRFKQINDSLGHLAGDALLVEVGRRLASVVRSGDVVARLGGDEFTMLLNGADCEPTVLSIADRVSRALASTMRLAGVDTAITASIGVVLVDGSYRTVEEIVRDADVAMYASKERGRNRCTIFSAALRDRFALASRLHADVRRTIDEDRFRLAYQPIYALPFTGQAPLGFEALLRYEQPDGSWVSAFEYIQAAEQSGMIIEIGDWVLREACVQAHRWARDHAERVVVAVNVSARQLAEPDFAAKVKATVGEFGLTHRQIALEVTESVLIGDIDASIAIFDELRRFGIKIFLDDFGTGYSSLNYLRRLPLDRVKIDRSFVSGAGDDVLADPVIVQSIIALAHKLGLRVVAEGVESARHLAALTELNCDAVQGFHFSQAVPAADATRMLLASGGLISTESVA